MNALGYLRVMFAVDDIEETLARLRKRGAQLVGEVVQYEDAYRLCYIRGPEGLLIGLAEQIVFPEIEVDKVEFPQGMDVTFAIATPKPEGSHEFLKLMGMPFAEK